MRRKVESDVSIEMETSGQVPVVLRFSHVGFSYESLPVLSNVSFHVHEGEFVAFVGPNGSGKTTILKLVLGLEQSQEGTVSLLGGNPKRTRYLVGYVPQHASYDRMFPVSVGEVVRMGRLRSSLHRYTKEDDRFVQEALEQVDLSNLLDRPYSNLSGGQRRRVLVARALAVHPQILLLDEPTANMDKESETRLFETLGRLKGKTTIMIVAHDMSIVSAMTDRVFCISSHGQEGLGRTVVQHKMVPEPEDTMKLRVLHNEDIPGDVCPLKENEEQQ